ncbi:Poly polymerase [Cerioporus squamosus]|nr:Poly polymerase [Cerioporus squamosus]
MPPRKKTAADGTQDGAPAATATRSSGRTRAPSAKAVAVANGTGTAKVAPKTKAATAAPKAKATKAAAAKANGKTTKAAANGKGKGKGKRAREESDEENDEEEEAEGEGAEKEGEEEEEEEEVKKPAAKRARTAKGAAAKTTKTTKKAVAKGKGKKAADADEDTDADGDGDVDMDGAGDEDEEDKKDKKKPASKKPASKKPAAKSKDVADLPAKMVTVIKRGAAPVDEHSGWVDTHQVLVTPKAYYKLQLLHPIGNTNQCYLYTRWGREFKKQFKAKTATAWEDRVGMVQKKGKYVWIERSYDDEDDGCRRREGRKLVQEGGREIPDSTLPSEIQTLCRLIFNTSMLDAHLSSMNYDANKLPLGKLSKSTILSGFGALKVLSEVISQPNGDAAKAHGGFRQACEELTGRYYSVIPHVFGRERPIVIDSLELLKKELELVDALGDMEVASKLISASIPKDVHGNPMNPLDAHFRSLELSTMEPIAHTSKEFRALQAYTSDTHGATHRHYGVQVLQAFRVEVRTVAQRQPSASSSVSSAGELGWQDSMPDGTYYAATAFVIGCICPECTEEPSQPPANLEQ